jgi:hypothetical protein
MKEKQFDHIENKIKEAVENSIPAFDEQNWERMEKLLDNDNRRRPFIWYIVPVLLCLIAGGAYLFFNPQKLSYNGIKTEQTFSENKKADIIGKVQSDQKQQNMNAVTMPNVVSKNFNPGDKNKIVIRKNLKRNQSVSHVGNTDNKNVAKKIIRKTDGKTKVNIVGSESVDSTILQHRLNKK